MERRTVTQSKPPFAFAIPLQSRAVSKRWDDVERNLRHTLRSIRASRGIEPLIVIACHEAPDLGGEDGKNIVILPAPFAPELAVLQRGADKIRKRLLIGAWLKSNMAQDGVYIMFLDADDLVHKDLVSYILDDDNRRSYLVDKGYRFDCSSGLLDRRASGFYRVCASSFVGYFTKEDLPNTWGDGDCGLGKFGVYPPHGHDEYGMLAAQLGKDPDYIPFYAATYLMNHGESLRLWKTGGKFRHLSVRDLVRPSQAKRILADEFSFETGDWASWDLRERARAVGVILSACLDRARSRLPIGQRELEDHAAVKSAR